MSFNIVPIQAGFNEPARLQASNVGNVLRVCQLIHAICLLFPVDQNVETFIRIYPPGYALFGAVFEPRNGQNVFSLLRNIQTHSGVQPAPNSVGTEFISWG